MFSIAHNGGSLFAPTIDGRVDFTPFSEVFTAESQPLIANDIQVLSVNAPPRITASNLMVDSNAGPQTIQGWATLDPGAPEESDQIVTATIINAGNEHLLAAGLELLPDGTLKFTPLAGAFGIVFFGVRVMDNGGTANGGDDTTEQYFYIEIGSIWDTYRIEVVDGNLIIETDEEINNFLVFGTDVPGRFSLHVNRLTLVPDRPKVVDGVTRDIRINTGGGDDWISLHNVYAAGDVLIDTGAGRDIVQLGSSNFSVVSTAQNLSVNLGEGNDWLAGANIFVRSNLTIDAGPGNDQVSLVGTAHPFVLGTSSAGVTTVQGGDGDDIVNLVYAFVVAGLAVDGGSGIDSLQLIGSAVSGPVSIHGGEQHDLLALNTNYFVSGVLLDGAAGDDRLLYANNISLAAAELRTGVGNDAIEVRNVMQRELRIAADNGLSSVDIRSSLLETLFADLGEGDDQIALFGNLAHGAVELHGGPGLADRLLDLGNSFRSIYRKRMFEFFV